jgi:hypothetical protein
MDALSSLIEAAAAEYRRNEMDEPVLLDGTSEMHARNALSHLRNERWDDALAEARIAAEQRDKWRRFLDIVSRIQALST